MAISPNGIKVDEIIIRPCRRAGCTLQVYMGMNQLDRRRTGLDQMAINPNYLPGSWIDPLLCAKNLECKHLLYPSSVCQIDTAGHCAHMVNALFGGSVYVSNNVYLYNCV